MKDTFLIRTYGIQELGVIYFPSISPRSASKQLVRWMRSCNPLWSELRESGYVPGQRLMTPRQVAIIVSHLSIP